MANAPSAANETRAERQASLVTLFKWSDIIVREYPASPTTGFHIGTLRGLAAGDVTATRSLDLTSLTLTFAPGTFGRGDFITFANFAFPVQLPVQFEVDADRVQGGQIIVTLSDDSTRTGTFFVERLERVNSFTGAGLVNADAATSRSHGSKD